MTNDTWDGGAEQLSVAAARAPYRSVRARATLCLEVAALGTLLLGSCWRGTMLSHAAQNGAPLWFRVLALALPLAGAASALLGTELWVRARPDRAQALQVWIRRGTPLLALWPIPVLLDQAAFAERPVFVLLATAAVGLGLERSLRHAAPSYRPWLAQPLWRKLVAARELPRWLAAFSILAAWAFVHFGSLGIHARMLSSTYDLGLFENLFWNALHGRQGLALGRAYFSQHAELLMYPLLPLFALAPRAETLLALQAALLVGAAVPLYLLAERWLASGWAALVFVLVYVSHPALHGPAFYDFHFLSLSAFFVLWASYFHVRRVGSGAFWLALLLALSCREDVAIGVAAVGAGLAWTARRACPRTRRVGLAMCVLGATWFVLVKYVWMRHWGHGSFSGYYSELIAAPARGFGGVLFTLLSNPLYVLSRLFSEQKLLLALGLLVPLAFLPLRHARAWFLLLPGLIVVGLANSDSLIVSVYFHYTTHFLPYTFVAALFALAARSRHSRAPVLSAVLLGGLVSAVHFSAFSAAGATDPFPHVSFEWSAEDAARQANFLRLAALVPREAAVTAGEYEGAHLAQRETLLALKFGIQDSAYVLYSLRSLRWGGRGEVESVLSDGRYGVVDLAGDLALLARDHDTSRNPEALALLQ